MVTWLVLLALVGSVFHLHSRLRQLEERLDDLQPAGADSSWSDFTVPAEPDQPSAAEVPETAEARAPATILYAEPRSPEPVSEPDESSETQQADAARWNIGFGFEELFGRRLPIWAGGITLAVAGVLIVKLSIESGLLKPPVRVIAGLLFGSALIAGAELALRFEERVRDPRVRQALSGAGLASLYASILVAVDLYHLIDPFAAIIGIAAVTALALFLSTRFGAPSALLGLAGGLAAPAMVGSAAPNVPLLSVYLALAVSGLCAQSRSQRWAWLGISALVGGFGWGALLLARGMLDTPSSISLGLYLLLLGVGLPALGFAGNRRNQLQLVAGIAAAAQLAALVATGGFALVDWGLFGLLSIACVWLARRDPLLAFLPGVGLLTALLLMGAWPAPSVGDFALVMSGFAVIYGGPAVWRLWRLGSLIEGAEIGALGLGALLLPMFHFLHADGSNDRVFGLLALGLTLAVAASAALGRKDEDRRADARFALLAIVSAVLDAAAGLLLLQIWAAAVATSLIGLALLHLGEVAEDHRLEPSAWVFAAAGVLAYLYSQLIDGTSLSNSLNALHWAAQAAIAAMFAWRARLSAGRVVAQFAVPLFLYVASGLLLPGRVAPLIAPVMLVAAAGLTRPLDQHLMPATASCLAIIAAWAKSPLIQWSTGAVASIGGSPMLVTEVPATVDALTKLMAAALAIAIAVLVARRRLHRYERIAGWTIAGVLGTVGAHSLYKHGFAIATPGAFVTFGLAERTVWEFALAGLALLAFRLRRPTPALVLAIGGAAHLACYTILLHNPLWSAQAVGHWPIANLLLPAYALAMVLAGAGRRAVQPASREAALGLGVAQMALITLFAFSELRQLFHGTLLIQPGLPVGEDILRSILAIALAIGFLLWGIARQQREWRIGSLVLMLAAVGKVFLFDASGLEGVTRIASFVALGLSLIGIGWLYARHLGSDRTAAAA